MPGTKGNRNRTLHGVYGYLALGSLPKGASYVRRLLGQFRAALEKSVQERDSEIGVYSAALIQSACRHEARAQLLTRWLRTESGEPALALADKLAIVKEIGKATDSRDTCLAKLGLDHRQDTDPWAVLDIQPARDDPADGPTAEPGSIDAADAKPDALEAASRPVDGV